MRDDVSVSTFSNRVACKFVEMNKEVNVRLWKIRGAKKRSDEYCDQASEQNFLIREAVRQEFWNTNTC